MRVTPGDIVIAPSGRIGLFIRLTASQRATLQFVENGLRHYCDPAALRRATPAEIERSHLARVRCNQSFER